MIERFIRWLHGYLLIELKGMAATRFINLCNGKDMLLWGIYRKHNSVFCYISLKNYRSLRSLARKCKIIPYIRKRFGFPFLLHRILRRKILINSALLFFVSIYIMSLYVWNISFAGNYVHTNEQLMEFLKEMDVQIGSKKSSINCAMIEEMIRKNYPDIGWVSVELKGTKLSARIEETSIPKSAVSAIKTDLETADLRAVKDGIILSILVRTGTSMGKAGDVVRRGDILVKGELLVIGDNQDITAVHEVLPDADIIMKTTEVYQDSFSMAYEKKKYTGIEKSGYYIYAFADKIFSYNPSNSFTKYDIIAEDINLRINKNLYLPFSYKKITFREYEPVQKDYTKEEAEALANKNLERYLEQLKAQGIEILSCKTQTKITNGKCITSGRIEMAEPAYEYSSRTEQ